ncbi:MAG: hypothetical protein ACI9WU_003842, partial [Myxococcota bacterium]
GNVRTAAEARFDARLTGNKSKLAGERPLGKV